MMMIRHRARQWAFSAWRVLPILALASSCSEADRKLFADKREMTAPAPPVERQTASAAKVITPTNQVVKTQRSALLDLYAAPRVGQYLEIGLTNQTTVWGYYRNTEENVVELATTNETQFIRIPFSDIRDEDRFRLQADAFIKRLLQTNMPGRADRIQSPEDLLAIDPNDKRDWPRLIMRVDLVGVHWGPDTSFTTIEDRRLYKGDFVFVVEQRGSWIKVARSRDDDEAYGWISKYAAMRSNEMELQSVFNDVADMMRDGFLVDIDVFSKKATVNGNKWILSRHDARVVKTRVLANYNKIKLGIGAGTLMIVDHRNGRKLAEYSISRGYREVAKP